MALLNELPATNAIRVGRLFHKPSAVTELLGHSVRAVFHEHRFESESTIAIGGSCTLISYGGRAYVVATRHQFALASDAVPDDAYFSTLRFQSSVGGYLKNIIVDSCIHETTNPDQEYHDLLFFRVQEAWLTTSPDRPYFLPVESFCQQRRIRSFFYGHPMSRNDVRHDPLEADIRTAVIDGELDLGFHSHADYFRRYRYPMTDYEVDGFSGGAVFSLIGSLEEGFSIVLDGVTVRGGNGYLYAVDADYLLEALRAN